MIPLKDSHSILKFPFWIVVIVLTNAFFFYLELTSVNPDQFISQYALIPATVDPSIPETLFPFVSSQFLHAGFLHIISNMIFLWVFGNNVEATLGFAFFPFFYLLSGIAASLTQYLLSPNESIPMLGASGAVAGVLGSYFALFPGHKIKTLIFILIFITIVDIPAYLLLFYWFIIQLFSGVAAVTLSQSSGGIAFLPHVGGFLFGFVTTLLILPRHSLRFKLS